MHITLASSSPRTTLFLPLTSPWPKKSIFTFPSKRPCRQHRIQRLSAKCFCRQPNLLRLVVAAAGGRRITEVSNAPDSSVSVEEDPLSATANEKTHLLKRIAKHMAFTLVCIVIGLCPITGFQFSAIAGAATVQVSPSTKTKGKDTIPKQKGHMYSDYTRKLLETVSVLVRCIEEVKSGNADISRVQEAVNDVKLKKKELQEQIMNTLYTELHKLRTEKEELVNRSLEIYESVMNAKKAGETLLKKKDSRGDGTKEKITKLEEEEVIAAEKEYNEILEAVEEIEDQISRAEFRAFSIGVRELSFIERESESLAKNFIKKMRWQSGDSEAKGSLTKLSRADVQRELQSAQRLFLEQMILPSIVEADYTGHSFDQDSIEFAQCIKRALETSRELQDKLEADVRRSMKKFGNEKLFVVESPPGEVTRGFPEVELKWMFGGKELVVPKASKIRLYHGWKKWREKAKADLKRKLLEDADFAKSYVAEKKEKVLLDRDRVASKTWYNEKQKRWEIDAIAVPYAVSQKLVENARIRHDWAVMYITLKGEEHEYFVNIKDYDVHFENSGGFDELYLRMLASGIPTSVQLMWIPFSELDIRDQFPLMLRVFEQIFTGFWNFSIVSNAREWVLKKIRNINDDLMIMMVFPIVEFIIPYSIRMRLGMAWPEYMDQTVASTWYLTWQSEAEMSFRSRKRDGLQWFFWFVIRSVIYGYIIFNVIRFMRRKLRLLGFGPLRSKDPNFTKLDRVKSYFKYRVRKIKRKRKDGVDPISTAFDQMKRVKNPPICLKDFASVDSMKEEINEVVAFLQNPKAFQEMGARAPRGVLIVGERGTGKTSLALAIAAEAKVPIVEVKAQQLEPGLWVGQSASNVRELFQTARDLAPVIIFVEDFDLFAGARGKLLHTKKQDHEAFINQLLVELDGFEKQDGVLLMATTRNLKQIDEALQRPGRMDRVFHLQRPTQAEREKILKIAAKENMDEELIGYVDWRKVAEKTALLRPIELKLVPMALEGSAFRSKFVDADELMNYCSWFATFSCHIPRFVWNRKIVKYASKMLVNHLGLTLTKEDLQNVVDLMEPYGQISNGMELMNPPLEWTRETKFPHAVWAAGRGLIAVILPNFDVVDNLWLEPLSWEGIGCTKISKAKNGGSLNGNVESRSYLEKKLVFCFGSYVASQLLLPFGEENILSSSELTQAQEIATRMVVQYGWGPDSSPFVYHYANAETPLSMGTNHEYEMATKVEKMYDLAYDKARGLLEKNRSILEKIVEELLEYEILSGKDLERIFAENGGIHEKEPFFLSNNHEQHSVTRDNLENGSALLIAPN